MRVAVLVVLLSLATYGDTMQDCIPRNWGVIGPASSINWCPVTTTPSTPTTTSMDERPSVMADTDVAPVPEPPGALLMFTGLLIGLILAVKRGLLV